MQKPSDVINEIVVKYPYKLNEEFTNIARGDVQTAIIIYLDEIITQLQQQIGELQSRIEKLEGPEPLNPATYSEMLAFRLNEKLSGRINKLEKQKYACPNCHRIVDELIKSNELCAQLVAFLPSHYCKYCIEDKK